MINLQEIESGKMTIEANILNELEIRDARDTIKELKAHFDQYTYSHLPIEREHKYIGCISGNDIRSFDSEKTLEDYLYAVETFYVRENDNWIEVLNSFAKNQTNILPVLDEENEYLGYVELNDFINFFTETPFLYASGGIIIVEKGYKDYSFSEISQIVESNGAHLLGAFVSKLENDVAQITIKIGQTGLNTILQTFRRYGYNVISAHQEDSFKSNLRDRSKYLDKYLNI